MFCLNCSKLSYLQTNKSCLRCQGSVFINISSLCESCSNSLHQCSVCLKKVNNSQTKKFGGCGRCGK